MAAHYIVHTDGSACKRKPVLGRWKNKAVTSLCSSEPEQSPVFSKAMLNQEKRTAFINDWETWEDASNCKHILENNNSGVHTTKVSIFLSDMRVTSFFNYYKGKCFPIFVPSSQQNQSPEEIACISCYSGSNSYLDILSWLLSQAYGSSLSLQCSFLRNQASVCIFLSLSNLFPCGFSCVLMMAKLTLQSQENVHCVSESGVFKNRLFEDYYTLLDFSPNPLLHTDLLNHCFLLMFFLKFFYASLSCYFCAFTCSAKCVNKYLGGLNQLLVFSKRKVSIVWICLTDHSHSSLLMLSGCMEMLPGWVVRNGLSSFKEERGLVWC